MIFKDYQGRSIRLNEECWQHICDFHPEINKADIAKTLQNPEEVRISRHKENVELYYALKVNVKKRRYWCVVVKEIQHDFCISTAMTVSTMKSGKVLYKRK